MSSRGKGKAGELELKNVLSRLFGRECRRGQQYSGIGGQDVVGLDGVHIECKRVEALNIHNAMNQSCRDAAEGSVPVVMHRRNRTEWLVTCRLDDLPALVKQLGEQL